MLLLLSQMPANSDKCAGRQWMLKMSQLSHKQIQYQYSGRYFEPVEMGRTNITLLRESSKCKQFLNCVYFCPSPHFFFFCTFDTIWSLWTQVYEMKQSDFIFFPFFVICIYTFILATANVLHLFMEFCYLIKYAIWLIKPRFTNIRAEHCWLFAFSSWWPSAVWGNDQVTWKLYVWCKEERVGDSWM